MGWLNFGGKKRDRAQGFGNSSKTKSRKRPKSFILEKIVTPSAGFGDWEHELDHLHQLLGSLSLSDLHLPNFLADSGVCPIDPSGPTNNLPPLIDFDPLGLYHDGIATQTPYNPGGAFETLPIALIPVDPHSPNPSNPNAIRQLLNFPLASQPLVGSIDTGVSADSPYLNYANIKKGRDYVGGDDNPLLKPGEGSEHGTFMLGIIDAINKTAPKWVGRAIDSGRWADSLVEFVDAAKASGQKNAIANLSLDLTQKNADGSVTTRYELTPPERSAIEYARQNGVMLVVAAGNDGGVMSVLGQASQEFDNIFTVGAGDINGRSIYSSYGRGLDIVADGGTTEHPGLSTVGNDLGTMAGTSVATAKVAGAASLVWAANPALNYRQVMEILKSTARDLGPSGWDDQTGFGFLNTLAAVDLAKKTKPEVYRPTPWVTPGTWSGEGKVTPEERAAKGGNSLAAATVQVSTNFSDSDRVDASQPDKYYQFTVNEPGYVKWNLISLNLVSGFPTPPNVSVIKADGKPGSHIFSKGISLSSSVIGEGQTSFSGGNFYDPGTYYLKVGNGAGSSFKDYNISTQFIADKVSSFTGNIQYRTQPYYSLDNSLQSAVFSGPAVSELSNLSGVVTYDNIQFNNRIAKYGIEVNESGKFRINLNSPNGKMELSVNKFIGSEDRPVQLSGLGVAANSDGWLELQLNKGRYDIEVKTPSNYWQEPDWNSTQQRLVRPYTLNATFTPNAPQPGQGKVPASAGAFDKTVVSSGVVNHYYKNGYLTVQPSGQASWYGYPSLVISGSAQVISEPVPLTDPDGNYSIQTAQNLLLTSGGADLGDGVNKDQVASGRILSSIGGKDLNDFYKFSLNSSKLVNLQLSQLGSGAEWSLIKDRNGNGQVDPGEVIKLGNIVTESQSLDLILGAGNYYLQIGSAASNAASQYVVNVVATPPENEVISSYNSDYYLVQNGQRRLVPDRETLNGLGINPNTVKRFSNEDLALIPLGQPLSPLIPQWQKSIDDAANQNSLGNPVTSYWDAADSPSGTKGYGRTYDRGSVYWTAKSGAIALVGGFADAYHSNENNGSKGWLGFPTGKQQNWEGGQRIDFEGGYIYRTAKEGARAFKYDESPWQKSITAEYAGHQGLLGNPTTGYWQAADSQYGTKGYGQNYDYGHVFWTAKYGAIALWRDFADTYNQTGGSNGWLGFPTKGKEDWQGGQRIEFEGGYIYWTEKEGARAFKNNELPWEKSIAAEYLGHQGLLGNPTTGYLPAADSQYGTKGYHQNYNNGHVFWTAKSGAIALWHGFANTYNQNGGSNGWLGFPTKGQEPWKDGQRIDFEGGYIYWDGQQAKAYPTGETINRKPVITSFPDFQMVSGTSFSLQTYANELQISDPDGDAIQFYEISLDPSRVDMEASTLEGQPLGKFIIPADQFNSIKFYGSVLGSNPVVIRAFDGKEWSEAKSFNITVVPSSNTGGVVITPGNGGSSSTTSPPPTPKPVVNNGAPLLQTVNAQYFLDSPQFYTTGNPFFPYNSPVSVGGTGGLPANCTWYASGRVKELGGRVDALSSMTGNAGTWGDNLSHGAWMPYEPLVGDIAEWVGDGHVAVVEKVNYNSDGSIRDIVISESNYAGSLHHIRTIRPGQSGADATGWPDRFIRVPKTGQITLEDSFNPDIYDDDPKPGPSIIRSDDTITWSDNSVFKVDSVGDHLAPKKPYDNDREFGTRPSLDQSKINLNESSIRASIFGGSLVKDYDPSLVSEYYDHFFEGSGKDKSINLDRLKQAEINYLDSLFVDKKKQLSENIESALRSQLQPNSISLDNLKNAIASNSSNLLSESLALNKGSLFPIINGVQKQVLTLELSQIEYSYKDKIVNYWFFYTWSIFDTFGFSQKDADRNDSITNDVIGGFVSTPAHELQVTGSAKPYTVRLDVKRLIQGSVQM